MKKIFIVICLLCFRYTSFCQSVKFGVLAGPNTSTFYPYNLNLPDEEISPTTNLVSFHISAFAEITWGRLSLQPGLNYASIGGNNYWGYSHGYGGMGTYKYTVQYLQVPVNVLYNIPLPFGKFFIGGGPYVGFGLSGKTTQTGEYENAMYQQVYFTPIQTKYMFSKADNPDYGINGLAGIHFSNGLLLSFDYGYGLNYLIIKNLTGNTSNNGVRNNVVGISVGYEFL